VGSAEETYELLAQRAATTDEPITYRDLADLTGVPTRFQGAMLGKLSRICASAGEPDLTAMVVSVETGEVSHGHGSVDPAAERRACHELHSARVQR
jgi:hypothetical protein